MTLSRRALLAAAAASPMAGASAQSPSTDRPLTIVVPFTPGSGPDVLARIIGDELRARRGQTVLIDNKAGASGTIGAAAAARAAPDGNTLLLYVNTVLMTAALAKSLPYDPVKSFAPVAVVATGSLALATHESLAVADTAAYIAAAKAKPDDITYASPGHGTPHHLAMELFKLTTGARLRHVPYTGTAGALKDLVAGHVHSMFVPVHVALPHARAGRLRLLALGSDKRSPLAPNLPTLGEVGVAGLDVDLWYGLAAPAGASEEVIARFNREINDILATPKVKQLLESQGLDPIIGPPGRLADLIRRDQPRWLRVVKEAGITPE